MKDTIKNNYALITGATSGIGYEIAKQFAQNNHNLVLVARIEERLKEVEKEMKSFGVDVKIIDADLFVPTVAEYVYNEVNTSGITVDYLVNDAGQGEWGKFAETDLNRQLDLIELNIKSLVSLTYYFLKDMLARNEGKILNVSSIVSKTGAPYTAVYSATKAFVLFFTLSIIKEIEDTNVTMTALLPGATDTDFFAKSGEDVTKVYRESKIANPADVAKDAYEALMSGKTTIISGLKNKFQGFMADIMPYDMVTSMSKKEHSPGTKPDSESRTHSDHSASQKERDSIERKNKPF